MKCNQIIKGKIQRRSKRGATWPRHRVPSEKLKKSHINFINGGTNFLIWPWAIEVHATPLERGGLSSSIILWCQDHCGAFLLLHEWYTTRLTLVVTTWLIYCLKILKIFQLSTKSFDKTTEYSHACTCYFQKFT